MNGIINYRGRKIMPWVIWGLSAIFVMLTYLLQSYPSIIINDLIQEFNINLVKIGFLSSCFSYIYIPMQLLSGFLIDTYGPRRIMKLMLFSSFLAIFWFASSHFYFEGILSRILMGLSTSSSVICAFYLGSRWFKPSMFLLIVALTEFIGILGFAAGEVGITKLIGYYGWRKTLLGISIITLLLAFLCSVFIQDYPKQVKQKSHQPFPFKNALKKLKIDLCDIIKNRDIWINGIYGGLMFAVYPTFGGLWAIPFFETKLNISVHKSAIVTSLFFVGGCLGSLIIAAGSSSSIKKKSVMGISALMSFIISLVIIAIPSLNIQFCYILLFSLGICSTSYTLCFPLASRYTSPSKNGITMGLTNTLCLIFGAPILQPLIGYLIRLIEGVNSIDSLSSVSIESFSIALLVIPLYFLLAFFCSFFIRDC